MYRIGIDIGGTFTDLTISDDVGNSYDFKSPTTPKNPLEGVKNAISEVASFYEITIKQLLTETDRIIHGTTISTNAVVQRNAAKTGLLCTEGFRHTLYYREGGKPDLFNLKMKYYEPYIPLYRTIGIRERINAEGQVVIPLDEDDVYRALKQLRDWEVEAVAVCFLWSIVNPIHEERVGSLIEEIWPGVAYSLSHKVQPVIREFIRSSATVLDASLKPVVSRYSYELQSWLSENGYKYEFLYVVASGGTMSVSEAISRPVYIIFSGPTVAPLAGKEVAAQKKADNLVITDVGGTTFDVSTLIDGVPTMTAKATIAEYPTGITSVEVNSIGAGGGSIATVDSGGLLHVGPRSAGAEPGPACYGKGGEEATVTDANVVLGFLNPNYFLGGSMDIYSELANKAIRERVAEPLKLSVIEASYAVFSLLNENMVRETAALFLKHGIDSRDLIMIAAGGGGPTHTAYICKELGINRIIIPKRASVFCADGMTNLDARFSISHSFFTLGSRFKLNKVNDILTDAENRCRRLLETQGYNKDRQSHQYFAQARYHSQIHDLTLQLPDSRIHNVENLIDLFHKTHLDKYMVSEPNEDVEFISWTLVSSGMVDKIPRKEEAFVCNEPLKALKGNRSVYSVSDGRMVDTPIYDGSLLASGNIIEGPAVIEDRYSTTLIPLWAKVSVTTFGDYFMELHIVESNTEESEIY